MGFFDTWQDEGSGNFIAANEKAELIKSATPLKVEAVRFFETGKYGARYIVDVDLDGEIRSLSFQAGSVESRDRLLDALKEYLASDEAEESTIVLRKKGRSVLIVDPNSEDTSEEE